MPDSIGILGGTFDPPHLGHLRIASGVADELSLEEVRFMPTGRPNFKRDLPVTPAAHRVKMLELAIADDPRFTLDTREVERPGVTYSVDTLTELADELPDTQIDFIVGADSAKTLVHWKGAARLARLARFVVACRPGFDFDEVLAVHDASPLDFDLLFVEIDALDVSSTALRAALAAGEESAAEMLPAPVAGYIRREALYRS